MRKLIFAVALALSACATEAPYEPPGDPGPSRPPPSREPPDRCGAAGLQSLIGKPRTEIPVPVNPRLRRVACTTCPVTMDFNPERLNIFFDAETGVVKEVRCG
ncbi:MAG TPA: I78 family peptidase inhibitor [Phenylobacterium sp.]|nr:I78 family peptidase inhibitor [Phenylobacterium sp.]